MLLTHALSLSVDSLVGGVAVAPLVRRASYRLAAAAVFGVADAAASLLGGLVATPLHGLLVVTPAMIAVYGAYLLAVSALAARGLAVGAPVGLATLAFPRRLPPFLILGALAVALSIDNLVSAAAGQQAAVGTVGCASAALALLGLTAGSRLHRLTDTRRMAWVGVGLLITACAGVLT
jgi:putative Mn2+ efflux pump MntP